MACIDLGFSADAVNRIGDMPGIRLSGLPKVEVRDS